jgi:Zn-dependent protease with chaperone function
MKARADAVFAALVFISGCAAGAVGAAIAALGAGGLVGVGAVLAGWVSACVLFVLETRRIPVSVLLVTVIGTATLASLAWTLVKAFVDQRRLARLRQAARQEVWDGHAVWLLPSTRAAAFCAGLIHPQIYLTDALVGTLEPEEIRAVVRHEAAHANAYVPLKALVARLFARTFFWLPALRDLESSYTLTAELAADEAAIRATSKQAVAAALTRVLDASVPAVGFANLTDARINKLLDPGVAPPRILSAPKLALSLLGLAGVAALAVRSPQIGGSEQMHLHAMTSAALLHRLLWERLVFVTALVTAGVLLAQRRRPAPQS